MPAVRHPALGIRPLDGDLDGHVPMARQSDLAMGTRAWCEATFKLHAEPGAELFGVGKRAPDTRAGCAQNDLFLYAVGSVMQLHGCILRRPRLRMQPSSCISTVLKRQLTAGCSTWASRSSPLSWLRRREGGWATLRPPRT